MALVIGGECLVEVEGGRPPNLKPWPSWFRDGTEAECGVVPFEPRVCPEIGVEEFVTISVSGASISWAPSSAMEGTAEAPGRGKNIERFRECIRPCLFDCAPADDGGGDALPPFGAAL